MSADFLPSSPRPSKTFDGNSQASLSNRGLSALTASKATAGQSDLEAPWARTEQMARMARTVVMARMEPTGETVLTAKVARVKRAIPAPCQSTSGGALNSASNKQPSAGVNGLICVARVAAVALWLWAVEISTPLACPWPQILQRRMRSSSSKTECGSEPLGSSSPHGSDQSDLPAPRSTAQP